MLKYEVIEPKSRALRVNLSNWCSRPTYRLGKPKYSDLLYHSHKGRISQRSALSLIEDICGAGYKTIELWFADRHTHTYRVKSNMETLLKVCDLALEKGACQNRRIPRDNNGNPTGPAPKTNKHFHAVIY